MGCSLLREYTRWNGRGSDGIFVYYCYSSMHRARPISQVLLLSCGLLGGLLFVLTYSLLGAFTPGYNWLYETISSLELFRQDALQQANFIVFGILNLCFAFALHRELRPGVSAKAIVLFQALTGIGLVGDGIFIHEPLHLVCDLVTFNSSLLTLLFFTPQFYKNPQWKGWVAYTIFTVLAMMGFLTAFGVADHRHSFAGLFERLALFPRTVWSVVFVWRLLKGKELSSSSRGVV